MKPPPAESLMPPFRKHAVIYLAFTLLSAVPASAGYEADISPVRVMLAEKRFAEAERTLTTLLEQYPGNPELLSFRGRARVWGGNNIEGMEDLRRSLSQKDDEEVRALLVREESLEQIRHAQELLQGKAKGEGERLLMMLFRGGLLPYESGIALGRHYRLSGESAKAAEVYATLHALFPADTELAYLHIRSLLNLGKAATAQAEARALPAGDDFYVLAAKGYAAHAAGAEEEAAELLDRALQLRDDDDIRLLAAELQRRQALKKADRAIEEGRATDAEKLLIMLYLATTEKYDSGLRLVRLARKRGDNVTASKILSELLKNHPNDRDLGLTFVDVLLAGGQPREALAELERWKDGDDIGLRRARALYRLHRYREAVAEYLKPGKEKAPADEIEAAEQAAFMQESIELMRRGRVREAEALWQELVPARADRYSDGYRLGMDYFRKRDFARAGMVFSELTREYPGDTGFFALAVEARLLDRQHEAAADMVETAEPPQLKYLAEEREDLLYRIRRRYIKVSALVAGYDNGLPTASEFEATVAGSAKSIGYSATVGTFNRFGGNDIDAAGDVTFEITRDFRGSLGVSLSPGSSFLPRYSFRGEISRPLDGGHEASLGYRRLSFANSDTDILVAGLLVFPSDQFSVNERIHVVPKSGSFASVTTLHYERHRIRGFYTLSLGTAAEEIREADSFRRYLTVGNRLGMEYRPIAAWSGGGEIFQEYRDTIYSRYGSQLYVKYWW